MRFIHLGFEMDEVLTIELESLSPQGEHQRVVIVLDNFETMAYLSPNIYEKAMRALQALLSRQRSGVDVDLRVLFVTNYTNKFMAGEPLAVLTPLIEQVLLLDGLAEQEVQSMIAESARTSSFVLTSNFIRDFCSRCKGYDHMVDLPSWTQLCLPEHLLLIL